MRGLFSAAILGHEGSGKTSVEFGRFEFGCKKRILGGNSKIKMSRMSGSGER
jgi:hypothetical protein